MALSDPGPRVWAENTDYIWVLFFQFFKNVSI